MTRKGNLRNLLGRELAGTGNIGFDICLASALVR